MTLSKKNADNITDFFIEIYSHNANFEMGSLYNTFMRLINHIDKGIKDLPTVKTIDTEVWKNSFFIFLPGLSWTICFAFNQNTKMYDIQVVKRKFILSENDYNRNSIFFRYFITENYAIESFIVIDEIMSNLMDYATTSYDVLKTYGIILYKFAYDILVDSHVYFVTISKEDVKIVNSKLEEQ